MAKRRRATVSKATRKASTQKRFFKKVQHNDPEVAKHWDFKATRNQNMQKMGLACDVNDSVRPKAAAPAPVAVARLEFLDIPQSDDLRQSGGNGRNPRRNPMSEDKQAYIAQLIAKLIDQTRGSIDKMLGDNFDKMERDVKKLNPQQHTAAKLKSMAARFYLLTDAQRLVPAPSKPPSRR